MELLVTLRNKSLFNNVINIADGIIVGKYFVTGYDDYSYEELKQLRQYCKNIHKKFFIEIENFISENEVSLLEEYFEQIYALNVDGIIFHDLGVYKIAQNYGIEKLLIYDGRSVMCNSLDSFFFLNKDIDSVVLSRELTLQELEEIVQNNMNMVSMQIFGHLRLSYSKRKFLTNYFKEIEKNYDYLNRKSLYLIEEQRDYKMPIIEDESGTKIYSDYVFEMYEEVLEFKRFIRYGIIDTLFIDDDVISKVCVDMKNINKDNVTKRRESLIATEGYDFSNGYLYRKTNITKDEQD